MSTPTIDTIPVATTPAGGWTEWPSPILAGCGEPRPEHAPDMAGYWQTIEVLVDGESVPGHPALAHVQRIEQAGDRVVVTAGGVIHDMRCDGTLRNGVHDVAAFDLTTEIHVVAGYEHGVHVLRPHGPVTTSSADSADSADGADSADSADTSDSAAGSDGPSIEVRRWREGAHLLWDYLGFTARLQYLAPSETDPAIVMAALEEDR